MPRKPRWKIPKNLPEVLEDNDGVWEDDRWAPLLVTAMSGTKLDGREIAIAWQIEFDPSDGEFDSANATLEEMEIEPDGYGWGEYIRSVIGKQNPGLAERLHTNDCEGDTCVIWVESEEDCRNMLEAAWDLIFVP